MTTLTLRPALPETAATSSLADIAAAAKPDRNRAVDAFRVVAMLAVALGHWLVIAIGRTPSGDVEARNALEVAPGLSWLTWLFQVMPLFFVVGGFASAMSLDAHWARHGRDRDWIAGRLQRLVAPTVLLAATWLGVLCLGTIVGVGGLAAAGAVGAAIPLWFLANYTIDTAFAPTMLRSLRTRRRATVAGLLSTFALIEVLHVAGVPLVGHVNWVLGWMIFQVGGFLWRDGSLPGPRQLMLWAASFWTAAIALVALGPWPVTMIHVSGVPFSPTHPPSIALVAFGAAFSATALAAAPAISSWLANNRRAWSVVVAGSAVSMSVYLWHFTAMIAASAVFFGFGWLPTAPIGSVDWWVQKVPLMLASFVLLIPIVAAVSRFERRALLAPSRVWTGSAGSMFALAATVSAALKLWSIGSVAGAAAGMTLVVVAGRLLSAGTTPATR